MSFLHRSSRSPSIPASRISRRSRPRTVIRRRPWIEQLERRALLTAGMIDGIVGQDAGSVASNGSEVLSALSADTRAVRDAGSTMSTAYDLGPLAGPQVYRGSVGWWDARDAMRFELDSKAHVQLSLDRLRADLQLSLFDQQGNLVARSNQPGTRAEHLNRTLVGGVYYAVVDRWLWSSSSYQLRLSSQPVVVAPPTHAVPAHAPPIDDRPSHAPPTTSGPPHAFPSVPYYGNAEDWNVNAVQAPEVWARGYQGQGVTVAVVDTGVDATHYDLEGSIWVNPMEVDGNGIDDDGNGLIDDIHGWDYVDLDNRPDDAHGHGTHVASIIAGAKNGRGVTGVAPQATIMPVRVLDERGSGTGQAVAAGIRYAADHGADIINLSLGGGYSSVIDAAVRYAARLGTLVVAAAGNGGQSRPGYPARLSTELDSVLSVGAHTRANEHASFSNSVTNSGAVQVDAPGSRIRGALPGGRAGTMSGTSMAAPHVSGIAALALSARPALSADQLRSLITGGARRSVSHSDALGGVDAATTVAYALAGYLPGAAAAAQVAINPDTAVGSAERTKAWSVGTTRQAGEAAQESSLLVVSRWVSAQTLTTVADHRAPRPRDGNLRPVARPEQRSVATAGPAAGQLNDDGLLPAERHRTRQHEIDVDRILTDWVAGPREVLLDVPVAQWLLPTRSADDMACG